MAKKKKKKGSKKGSKKSSKGATPTISRVPTVEEQLWVRRFQISEQSHAKHRENITRAIATNEKLQLTLEQTEEESIQVIQKLKNDVDTQVKATEAAVAEGKELRRAWREDIDAHKKGFDKALSLEQTKTEEWKGKCHKLQSELDAMEEFSKMRLEMEQSLSDLKQENEKLKSDFEEDKKNREAQHQHEKLRMRQHAVKVCEFMLILNISCCSGGNCHCPDLGI
eukprot:m.27071 g.27071  ORF g.27071 m.27071 type:complete len:224 (-) comp7858_c0_seq2:1162-1833(-)